MILRELITKMGFQVDKSGLDGLDETIKGVTKRLEGVADKSIKLGRTLTARVTLPLAAVGVGLIKAASDAEETESKFEAVFSGIIDESDKTARALAENFGFSSVKAKQLLGDTGDLLTGFGFTQESALELSNGVNELAADLASFTNFSGGAEGASRALTKALLGERESIKLLGIAIQEEDLKKRVQILRAKGITFETERQAKAFATLQLAQEQSKNAIGDFARTSDGFANQFRILRGELFDLAVEFGKVLLPAAKAAVTVVRSLVRWFRDLSPEFKQIIVFGGALVAVIGPLLLAFGGLIKAALFIKTSFASMGVALGVAKIGFGGLLLVLGKFILIGGAIILVLEDILAFFNGKKSVTGAIIEGFGSAFDFIEEQFQRLPNIVKTVVKLALTKLRFLVNTVQGLGGALGAIAKGNFKDVPNAFKQAFKGNADVVTDENASLSAAIGLSDDKLPSNAPAPASAVPQGLGDLINNITAPININVPEGTTPEQVGPAVQKGVSEGIGVLLRETRRQTLGPVVN